MSESTHHERRMREDTESIKIELDRVQKHLAHMAEAGQGAAFSEEFKADMHVSLSQIANQVTELYGIVFGVGAPEVDVSARQSREDWESARLFQA